MLSPSENILFLGHNHLLTTGANHFDYHPDTSEGENQSVGSSVPVVRQVVMTWKEDSFRGG